MREHLFDATYTPECEPEPVLSEVEGIHERDKKFSRFSGGFFVGKFFKKNEYRERARRKKNGNFKIFLSKKLANTYQCAGKYKIIENIFKNRKEDFGSHSE